MRITSMKSEDSIWSDLINENANSWMSHMYVCRKWHRTQITAIIKLSLVFLLLFTKVDMTLIAGIAITMPDAWHKRYITPSPTGHNLRTFWPDVVMLIHILSCQIDMHLTLSYTVNFVRLEFFWWRSPHERKICHEFFLGQQSWDFLLSKITMSSCDLWEIHSHLMFNPKIVLNFVLNVLLGLVRPHWLGICQFCAKQNWWKLLLL